VLPLHDFESCAINRALPPLHNVKKTPISILRGPPAWRLSPYDDAANVADLLWDENPAMFLSIDLIEHQPIGLCPKRLRRGQQAPSLLTSLQLKSLPPYQ